MRAFSSLASRFFVLWLALVLFGCSSPIEQTPPFIKVTVLPPALGVTPVAAEFEILVEAIVEGNLIQKVIEAPTGDSPLPLSFVVTFSEEIRGQVIDISVTGFSGGVDVFSGSTTGIANTDEVELVVGFCGDESINDDRDETCDEGAGNSDVTPDACRTSCLLAGCGDGVVDAGEACDDGAGNSDVAPDACRTSCEVASCGDDVVDAGEACDDGANNSDVLADACRTNCSAAICGDGVVDTNEECDDANDVIDDGCDPGCFNTIVQISAGNAHSCVLTRSGKVKCWGSNSSGQLGYGNTLSIGDDEAPSTVGFVNVGGVVTQISAGTGYTCALLSSGNVRCWGLNFFGQLGYGNTSTIGDNEAPASAGNVNVGASVAQISAGNTHTCALLNNEEIRCWGSASLGRLGYGNANDIGDDETPSSAGSLDLGVDAVQIDAGGAHSCAVTVTGNVRCWGSGNNGKLGYISTENIGDDEIPSTVGDVNVGGVVLSVVIGNNHSCAILNTDNVRCWGAGGARLGYENPNDVGDNETPASFGDVNVGAPISQLSAGFNHTCALLSTGNVRCWGAAVVGLLGYGNLEDIGDDEPPSAAGDVSLGDSVLQITSGTDHTCALLQSGGVRCWGLGSSGQLGYGNTENIGDDESPSDIGDVSIF